MACAQQEVARRQRRQRCQIPVLGRGGKQLPQSGTLRIRCKQQQTPAGRGDQDLEAARAPDPACCHGGDRGGRKFDAGAKNALDGSVTSNHGQPGTSRQEKRTVQRDAGAVSGPRGYGFKYRTPVWLGPQRLNEEGDFIRTQSGCSGAGERALCLKKRNYGKDKHESRQNRKQKPGGYLADSCKTCTRHCSFKTPASPLEKREKVTQSSTTCVWGKVKLRQRRIRRVLRPRSRQSVHPHSF